jgi:signal transduction histidine kinase
MRTLVQEISEDMGFPTRRTNADLVVGEALQNVYRHSCGDCTIRLVRAGDGLLIEMEDNGPGFDVDSVPIPEPEAETGKGVYHIQQFGGSIASTIGIGTKVSVEVRKA